MTIDLSGIGTWIWIIAGLVIVFIILRYFFHVVVHIFHFVMNFFWHGCITIIVLLGLYFILRALHIL
jgi:hypothetical protein